VRLEGAPFHSAVPAVVSCAASLVRRVFLGPLQYGVRQFGALARVAVVRIPVAFGNVNISGFAQGFDQGVIGGGESFAGGVDENWARGNGGREIVEVQFLRVVVDFTGEGLPAGS
jgi:hypothetical protein